MPAASPQTVPNSVMRDVALSDIRIDPDLQMRVREDDDTVNDYRLAYVTGPPDFSP